MCVCTRPFSHIALMQPAQQLMSRKRAIHLRSLPAAPTTSLHLRARRSSLDVFCPSALPSQFAVAAIASVVAEPETDLSIDSPHLPVHISLDPRLPGFDLYDDTRKHLDELKNTKAELQSLLDELQSLDVPAVSHSPAAFLLFKLDVIKSFVQEGFGLMLEQAQAPPTKRVRKPASSTDAGSKTRTRATRSSQSPAGDYPSSSTAGLTASTKVRRVAPGAAARPSAASGRPAAPSRPAPTARASKLPAASTPQRPSPTVPITADRFRSAAASATAPPQSAAAAAPTAPSLANSPDLHPQQPLGGQQVSWQQQFPQLTQPWQYPLQTTAHPQHSPQQSSDPQQPPAQPETHQQMPPWGWAAPPQFTFAQQAPHWPPADGQQPVLGDLQFSTAPAAAAPSFSFPLPQQQTLWPQPAPGQWPQGPHPGQPQTAHQVLELQYQQQQYQHALQYQQAVALLKQQEQQQQQEEEQWQQQQQQEATLLLQQQEAQALEAAIPVEGNAQQKAAKRMKKVKVMVRKVVEPSSSKSRAKKAVSDATAKYKATLGSGNETSGTNHFFQNISSNGLLEASEEKELALLVQDFLKLQAIEADLSERLGREPQLTELAREAKMDVFAFNERLYKGKFAKRTMVDSNMRLVVSIAKGYQQRGLSLQELITEGVSGLVRGVEKFDPSKGFKFSTYAHWWVRQAMTRALAEQGRVVRLPTHLQEQMSKLRKIKAEYVSAHGKDPSNAEVARLSGLTEEKVLYFASLYNPVVSLDQPMGKDKDGASLQEGLASESAADPVESAVRQALRVDLEAVVDTLPEREAMVLKMRYGLGMTKEMTLDEVGRAFNVTRERIRQIEAKAIRRLRSPARQALLKEHNDVLGERKRAVTVRRSMGLNKM